jgi:hypothetical protein
MDGWMDGWMDEKRVSVAVVFPFLLFGGSEKSRFAMSTGRPTGRRPLI